MIRFWGALVITWLSFIAASIFVQLLIGCAPTTRAPQSPIKPEVTPTPVPTESPDDVFNREFDACWGTYKECLKTQSDSVCFPPHEKCVIAAYRKLKKARGE